MLIPYHQISVQLVERREFGMQVALGIVTCVDKNHVDLPVCDKEDVLGRVLEPRWLESYRNMVEL